MSSLLIHLLRHGKTEANEHHQYCGSTDMVLSVAGIEELNHFKQRIHYPKADIFFTSGMLRTVQTLNILYDHPPHTPVSSLREMDFGAFELHSYEELKHDPDYLAWISDIENARPPRGERKIEFTHRVFTGFDGIINHYLDNEQVKCCCLVTHGGVIAALMYRFFPDHGGFFDFRPECGLGYSIDIIQDTGGYKATGYQSIGERYNT